MSRARPGCDVLHIAWSGRIGGIERLVEGIARAAAARAGATHRVLLLDGTGPIGDRLESAGLAVRLHLRSGWDLRGLVRLARVLRRLRPRVVHLHTHAVGSHLVALAALPRAARVYSEHSPRALRGDLKLRLLYRLLRRSVDGFAAATPTTADALAERGIERRRIAVVPNGHAVPRREPTPRATGGGRLPAVGLVARLEPQKRPDLFLEVLAELRTRGVGCTGVIVGGGSLHEPLLRQRSALGLDADVELAGEQEDVVPWLDRLDLFLMTSEYEPFGIAVLDAIARGVPVVAMPCPGGLADLVERGGLLLPDRRVAGAADVVERLLRHDEERARLAARGAAILDEHAFERVVEQLDALYRTL